jgi:hypothetical protein
MKLCKISAILLLCLWLLLDPVRSRAEVDQTQIPEYVTAGLSAYKTKGYEAAVHVWLADSPYKDAVNLVASLTFFKNIQMLSGKYLSYDVLMTQETISSNRVYVRMNFERMPGYILFTSLKRENQWVLGDIKLDRMQRFAAQ